MFYVIFPNDWKLQLNANSDITKFHQIKLDLTAMKCNLLEL